MKKTENYWAIIPAAGSGSRMQADRPKQYLVLHGKTILEHTLARIAMLTEIRTIMVCVAPGDTYWDSLRLPAHVRRVGGGLERHESVFNALQALREYATPEDWVLIHDAARPCVRLADIRHLMTILSEHPVGGLLALPVRDTMKRADDAGNVAATVARENLWHALTPQLFRFGILYKALQQARAAGVMVTDDAQAVEYYGLQAVLVPGSGDNLKITRPEDLAQAAWFLAQQEIV